MSRVSSSPSSPRTATVRSPRREVWEPRWAVAVLGLLVAVAYHNSFSGPFIFDDAPAIAENPSIRHLASLGEVLSPPPDEGQTIGGRPVVNLTLALNYALGGVEPRGYHIFNVIVHALAVFTLFGVVRRTLLLPRLGGRFDGVATLLALAIAGVWAVHPLLTESVTYIVQRAESLMGFFYLLTLYAFARAMAPPGYVGGVPSPRGKAGEGARPTVEFSPLRTRAWLGIAFFACLLGMATKEVMVSAPLVVLLYDRTFVAASWREVRDRRWIFYAGLVSTWLLLAGLVRSAGNRGGTAGIGAGDSSWEYALIQCRAIVHYLRLAFWPDPLVFDYGMHLQTSATQALPFAAVVVLLLAATGFALWRRPAVGFLGFMFFAILAPSSSFVPIAVQPMAEHRMYLPLAVLITLVFIAGYVLLRRRVWWLGGLAIAVLAPLTVVRNRDYRSELDLWSATATQRPENARAQCHWGDALMAEGRVEEALPHYAAAVSLESAQTRPGGRTLLGDFLVNHGNALLASGREAEAVARYEEALRVDPNFALAHYNLGSLLLEKGKLEEAALHFEQALRLDPVYVQAHNNLASALLQLGRLPAAIAHYEEALRLEPSAKAHFNLGNALLHAGRAAEARAHFEAALQLEPGFPPAQQALGALR